MKNRVGMVLITCIPLIIGLMLIMLWTLTVPPAFAAEACCAVTSIAGGTRDSEGDGDRQDLPIPSD